MRARARPARPRAPEASIGALVREAIDVAYPNSGPTREQAFEILRSSPPADHGSPEDVKREILSVYERAED